MGLFIKTFLVGLTLVMKHFRHYFNKWENELKPHMSADVFDLLKSVIDNVTLILEAITGTPVVLMEARVQQSDPRYKAALVNLRERSQIYRDFVAQYPINRDQGSK